MEARYANVGIQMTYLIDGNAFREFYKSNDVGLVYANEFNHWMNTYDPSEAKRIPMDDSEILIGRIWEEGHGKFRRTLDSRRLLEEVNAMAHYKGKRAVNYRIYTYNDDGEEHHGTTRGAVKNAILMGYRYIALRDANGEAYATIDTWLDK